MTIPSKEQMIPLPQIERFVVVPKMSFSLGLTDSKIDLEQIILNIPPVKPQMKRPIIIVGIVLISDIPDPINTSALIINIALLLPPLINFPPDILPIKIPNIPAFPISDPYNFI